MRYLLSVLTLLALNATVATAQDDAPSRGRAVSATLFGGGIVPAADFNDGASFGDAGLFGGALTLWPTRSLGLRGSLLRTKADARIPLGGTSPLAEQDPAIWFYGTDVVLQPSPSWLTRWGWAPYLFAGVGAKHYALREDDRNTGYTALAGSLGAGLEYMFSGRWGVQAEARHLKSRFERFEYEENQRDWILAGGITVRI